MRMKKMRKTIPIRVNFAEDLFGEYFSQEQVNKIYEKLKDGELKFAPSFLKTHDGKLELLSIGIVPVLKDEEDG